MFSQVLKIIPKLEAKDLDAMQKALQGRFTKLTKSFGKGLVNVLKGGGIAGIALKFIDKLLNPLKEVQEAIDRALNTSDDLATNATQFNTSAGKLYKLVQLAKSTGMDQGQIFDALNKFQGAVAQAKANPTDDSVSSVRNYVNQEDTAEAFFSFIQQLQKMTKQQQVLIQTQIFGEKSTLKMASFLQSNFAEQAQRLGMSTTGKYTTSIEKLASLKALQDVQRTRNEGRDIVNKAEVINAGMITARTNSERLAFIKENKQIASYENLQAISDTVARIEGVVGQGISLLGSIVAKVVPFIDKATIFIEKFMKSPAMRGIRGLFGGKDD